MTGTTRTEEPQRIDPEADHWPISEHAALILRRNPRMSPMGATFKAFRDGPEAFESLRETYRNLDARREQAAARRERRAARRERKAAKAAREALAALAASTTAPAR